MTGVANPEQMLFASTTQAFLEKEACHSGAHAPAYEPGIQERSVGSAWFWIPGSALRAAPE